MVITCEDLIFNDFRMSDYGLISGNGSDGIIDSTEDMGMAPTITKVFTGESPHSTFISQKYETNPQFTVKLTKANCDATDTEDYFSENELRMYNRLLTGKPGYSWLKVINDEYNDTDYYYRAKVVSIAYQQLGYHIIGYEVTFELDGGIAYSEEQTVYITASANTSFYVFCNSDDLYNYTLPVVKITPSSAGTLTITNITDNNRITQMENMNADETLTIDSRNELLFSSRSRQYILNDFNIHWLRLLPGKNEIRCNMNATIGLTFRAARKVGFVS